MSSLGSAGSKIILGAGATKKKPGDNAAACFRAQAAPKTPDHIKRFRRSQFGPGERHIHYGTLIDERKKSLAMAKLPPSQQVYGASTKDSDHVDTLFESAKLNSVQAQINEFKERKYKESNIPLGKARGFGHQLPEQVQQNDFAFGVKANASEDAKQLLYPQDDGSELHPEVYLKSHHAYPPGGQVDRKYDWKTVGINPADHRFGKITQKGSLDNTRACLDRTGAQRYKVVSKSQTDFMSFRDQLGKVRDHGLSLNDPNHVYGLPSDPRATGKEWNAADCLRGDYSIKEQQPDADLGRRTIRGSVSTTMNRAFGCPSIRDDIPAPKRNSVADTRNFGGDAGASSLIAPSRFSAIGVSSEDFVKQRPPAEIRLIFEKATGQTLTDDEFMRVWYRAATAGDLNKDGVVSVGEFRDALNEYSHIKLTGKVPGWWHEAGIKGPAQLESDITDSLKN